MNRFDWKPSNETDESIGIGSLFPISLSFVLTVATYFCMFVSLERGGPFAGMANVLVYFWTGVFLVSNWSLTLIILVLVPSWRRLATGYTLVVSFIFTVSLVCFFYPRVLQDMFTFFFLFFVMSF